MTAKKLILGFLCIFLIFLIFGCTNNDLELISSRSSETVSLSYSDTVSKADSLKSSEYILIEVFDYKRINPFEIEITEAKEMILDFRSRANNDYKVFVNTPENNLDFTIKSFSNHIEVLYNLESGSYPIEVNGFKVGYIIVKK
jgi:hypothetical protein